MFKGMINLLISASYAAVITYMVGKWGFCMAYMERGYAAVGGEYLLIPMTYWAAGGAMHCFINALEEWKHGQNSKKGRSRRTAWIQNHKKPVSGEVWHFRKKLRIYAECCGIWKKSTRQKVRALTSMTIL